jgi:uncharacterized protein YndB with AHSA1/START domain
MLTKEYKIEIKAEAKKVWFALWDPYYYRKWTSVFCEGSYAITDNWKQGSRVHFLAPSGEGMYSVVTENKPFEKMFFTHIGNIKNFEEQPLDEETTKWTNSRENYTLTENNGTTSLVAQLDIYEKFLDFFEGAFPNGLQLVKESAENFFICVQAKLNLGIDEVWKKWNTPEDIVLWNAASEDWHTTKSSNDLRVGGTLSCRMEAKDGSMGFDFEGVYSNVVNGKIIEYSIADGRKVKVSFEADGEWTMINESFEPENMNSYEMQRDGWQAILNNFKKYSEG